MNDMKTPQLPTDYNWFNPQNLLEYLKRTEEENWCTDVVKTSTGQSCLIGHVFDWAGGDSDIKRANQAMDLFEIIFATSYMFYPVNDGKDKRYPQPTPKQRCVAYFEDLLSGKEKTSYQLMQEYEHEQD